MAAAGDRWFLGCDVSLCLFELVNRLRGMEDALLDLAEYGRQLAFMGGVDPQDALPHGSVADVRRATARLLEGMTADGGGYILAASHTVAPETPDENIFAMYEVAGVTREEIFDRATRGRNGQHTEDLLRQHPAAGRRASRPAVGSTERFRTRRAGTARPTGFGGR